MDKSKRQYCMCDNSKCPICEGHDCNGKPQAPIGLCSRCYNWLQRFNEKFLDKEVLNEN